MSVEKRKREYDRLVTEGKVPPECLVKEFGTLPLAKVNVIAENEKPVKKKKGKK